MNNNNNTNDSTTTIFLGCDSIEINLVNFSWFQFCENVLIVNSNWEYRNITLDAFNRLTSISCSSAQIKVTIIFSTLAAMAIRYPFALPISDCHAGLVLWPRSQEVILHCTIVKTVLRVASIIICKNIRVRIKCSESQNTVFLSYTLATGCSAGTDKNYWLIAQKSTYQILAF